MFDFDELELKARNCTTADDFVRGPHTILLEILRFSSRMKLKQANQDFVSIGTHLVNAACALRQMQLQSLLHRRKSPQKQTRDGWCFLRSCAVSLKADPPKKEQEQPNVRTPRFCLSMNIILVINQSLLLVGTYQPFWLSHSLSRLMGNSPC